MKNQNKSLEEQLKEAFEGAEMSPSNDLWAHIDGQLSQKENIIYKRKATYFKRLAVAAIIILSLIGTYEVWQHSNSSNLEKNKALLQNNYSEGHDTKTNQQQLNNLDNSTTVKQQQLNNSNTTTIKQQTNQQQLNNFDNSTTIKQQQLNNSNTTTIKQQTNQQQLDNNLDNHRSPITPMAYTSDLLKENKNTTPRNVQEIALIENNQTINPTEVALKPIEVDKEALDQQVRENNNFPPIIPSLNKGMWVGVNFSPAYLSFNPVVQNNTESNIISGAASYNKQNIAQSFSKTTQSNLSYQMGMQMGYGWGKHWTIQTGAQYILQRTQVPVLNFVTDPISSATYPEFVKILEKDDNFTYSSTQNVELPLEPKKDKTGREVPIMVQNNYHYVSIPLSMTYRINNKRLSYGVQIGFTTDLLVKNIVNTLQTEIPTRTITPNENSYYKSIGLHGTVGLDIVYRVTPQYSIFASPQYKTALTSITKSDALIQVKPTMIGIGFGARYHF